MGFRLIRISEGMSTRMGEADWTDTLELFRACLPRRGRKASNDRLFPEAMHFFTLENVRWRALPDRFGRWNSVRRRSDRLSKAGVFEAFFDMLASQRREGGCAAFPHLARYRAGHHAAPTSATRAIPARPIAAPRGPEASLRSSPQGQPNPQARPLSRIFHKARTRIEQGIGGAKRFKRVAPWYEKTERNHHQSSASPLDYA
jgi:transposase